MSNFKHFLRSRHSRAGFTLLELLVAMTVLGLLMALLSANMQTSTKAWLHSESRFFDTNKIQHVQTFLQKQISQIYPKFMSAVGSDARVDFDGRRDTLQFLSPVPEALDNGGRAYTKLSVVQSGNDVQLVMTQREELAWNESAKMPSNILIKGLKSAEFSYFGKDATQTLPSWHDSWLGKQELPKLIRVRAKFDDGKRSWPELIVAPRISVDVGCVYDPLTKYCQGR
jgi:general secretion pathway protein J